jgi:hypothetical protein
MIRSKSMITTSIIVIIAEWICRPPILWSTIRMSS